MKTSISINNKKESESIEIEKSFELPDIFSRSRFESIAKWVPLQVQLLELQFLNDVQLGYFFYLKATSKLTNQNL